MTVRRTPERVHVVRPPQDDQAGIRDGRSIEIVRMLAQVSDKLKRSEAERYELLAELREYRKALAELEDKAEQSERSYLSLEQKIKTREKLESELAQRQARFEKFFKEAEDRIVKTAATHALVDRRLKDTEDRQTAINERLDESVAQQARLDRRIEKVTQDKMRMARKVERLEEILVETQDTLRARAMVLLTDQSTAAQTGRPQLPAWLEGKEGEDQNAAPAGAQRWHFAAPSAQALGMGAMVVAALLLGWTINQAQQPEIPQIAVLQGGGLARLNLDESRWEPVVLDGETVPSASLSDLNAIEQQKLSARLDEEEDAAAAVIEPAAQAPLPESGGEEDASAAAETQPASVLDYSDEQLLRALEEDPDALAAELNEIAPGVSSELDLDKGAVTPPLANFSEVAFRQEPSLREAIAREVGTAPLSQRISADPTLPDVVKRLEAQAFAGVAEAQHDLAAIYTAGHGGVTQDFKKAALWFREAADNGIANARYNLGVLYHQGLGVDRDLPRALYWYREAARLDHPEAQYNLGIAHIEGIGSEYNPPLAAAFFERAANNGIMEAAYNLGLIHENGLMGGDAKPEEALLWYKIAADQGSPDAKAAMEQLAKSLQIGMDDVDKLVERLQAINEAVKGRRAGPQEASVQPVSAEPVRSSQLMLAQIQERLMALGLYPGPADGIRGPLTEDAIRTYQSRQGLPVTGQPSEELLTRLLSN